MKHVHEFDPRTLTCSCGRTAEQEFRGELTHPGVPTTERIWELQRRLYLLIN